jgi:hypothetical protein
MGRHLGKLRRTLEAEHLMDLVSFPSVFLLCLYFLYIYIWNTLLQIRYKLMSCLDFLGSDCTVYFKLAVDHWSDGVMEVNHSSLFRFGILTCDGHGKDFNVCDPLPA